MKTEKRPKTLDQVVSLLGMAYTEWKEKEQVKNDYKEAFFALADEALRRDGLGLKLYDVIADSEPEARQRAELHNPGWRIDELRPHRVTPRLWEIILIEDATLKPFTYEHDGVKYARQVSRGAVMVDDVWLAEADPELYEQSTYGLPWGERFSIPIQLLEKNVLSRLQKYIYNAKPRVSLAKPQPVKPEE